MNITEVKRKINKLVKEIYPEEEYKTQRQHLAKKLLDELLTHELTEELVDDYFNDVREFFEKARKGDLFEKIEHLEDDYKNKGAFDDDDEEDFEQIQFSLEDLQEMLETIQNLPPDKIQERLSDLFENNPLSSQMFMMALGKMSLQLPLFPRFESCVSLLNKLKDDADTYSVGLLVDLVKPMNMALTEVLLLNSMLRTQYHCSMIKEEEYILSCADCKIDKQLLLKEDVEQASCVVYQVESGFSPFQHRGVDRKFKGFQALSDLKVDHLSYKILNTFLNNKQQSFNYFAYFKELSDKFNWSESSPLSDITLNAQKYEMDHVQGDLNIYYDPLRVYQELKPVTRRDPKFKKPPLSLTLDFRARVLDFDSDLDLFAESCIEDASSYFTTENEKYELSKATIKGTTFLDPSLQVYPFLNPSKIPLVAYGQLPLFANNTCTHLIFALAASYYMSKIDSELDAVISHLQNFIAGLGEEYLEFDSFTPETEFLAFIRSYLHPVAVALEKKLFAGSEYFNLNYLSLKSQDKNSKEPSLDAFIFTRPKGCLEDQKVVLYKIDKAHDEFLSEILKDYQDRSVTLNSVFDESLFKQVEKAKESGDVNLVLSCTKIIKALLNYFYKNQKDLCEIVLTTANPVNLILKIEEFRSKASKSKLKKISDRDWIFILILNLMQSLEEQERKMHSEYLFELDKTRAIGSTYLKRKTLFKESFNRLYVLVIYYLVSNNIIRNVSTDPKNPQLKYTYQTEIDELLVEFVLHRKEYEAFIKEPEINFAHYTSATDPLMCYCDQGDKLQVLKSASGYKAFAELLTVYETCMAQNVSFINYLMWLFANVKYRITQFCADKNLDPTPFLVIPRCTKLKDGSGNLQTASLYESKIPLDNIDFTGLDPITYKKILEADYGKYDLDHTFIDYEDFRDTTEQEFALGEHLSSDNEVEDDDF